MLDILSTLQQWLSEEKAIALAVVTRTWGSSPRPVGSVLAVTANGQMAGSVSGGCVEGAVMKEALEVLKTNVPKQLHYGISNDDAWSVGLMCGGELDVFVQPFPTGETRERLLQALQHNEGGVLVSWINEAYDFQHFVSAKDKQWLVESGDYPFALIGLDIFEKGKSQIIEESDKKWFLHVFPKKSQLLIIGAAHISVELVRFAKLLDFETIVIDPRQTFAEQTQFPEPPYQLLVDWPAEVLPNFELDAYTYAVLLTHDPKIDDQALTILLNSKVAYIGALGSRKTHEKRMTRLREAGFTEEAITRIHAPVGVDIGAQGAKEIALSIVAELVRVKNGVLGGWG